MQTGISIHTLQSRRQSGLTLVEILVTSTLLLVITLGLMAMFNQTQRAFRTGLRQVDVLESGRATLDFIARDLAQVTDARVAGVTNVFTGYVPANDFIQFEGGAPLRTNRLYDVFALTRFHDKWIGIGFAVSNAVPGVGTLYRFRAEDNSLTLPDSNDMYWDFQNALSSPVPRFGTNFNRLADGVIHFQVRLFDNKGMLINTNGSLCALPNQFAALPHYIEVEMGVLEPQTFEQARSMMSGNPALDKQIVQRYLEREAGKVHIFRQKIPIRTARQ